jgi:hypothetical protein
MTASTKTAIIKFNGENFQTWDDSVIESGNTASSLHRKGLLGFILSEPDYIMHATLHGDAPAEPFQPLSEAQDPMPAAGAQFAPWGYVKEQKLQEQRDITAWTIVFIAGLDDNSKAEMSEGRFRSDSSVATTHVPVDGHSPWRCDYRISRQESRASRPALH